MEVWVVAEILSDKCETVTEVVKVFDSPDKAKKFSEEHTDVDLATGHGFRYTFWKMIVE